MQLQTFGEKYIATSAYACVLTDLIAEVPLEAVVTRQVLGTMKAMAENAYVQTAACQLYRAAIAVADDSDMVSCVLSVSHYSCMLLLL